MAHPYSYALSIVVVGSSGGKMKSEQWPCVKGVHANFIKCTVCKKWCSDLGDTLDGDGRTDLAATTIIGNGWMKFRELLSFLTFRVPPPYR